MGCESAPKNGMEVDFGEAVVFACIYVELNEAVFLIDADRAPIITCALKKITGVCLPKVEPRFRRRSTR